ncbi:MAG: hypothetical protein DWH79_03160 [Planctomycetota bacterium]|nr:MAG: hypothetical protein DWH79_03160 [Planctomycetota bacterium]
MGSQRIATGTVNFVNSVAFLAGPLNGGSNDSIDDNRFLAGPGGTINATASTITADLPSLFGQQSLLTGSSGFVVLEILSNPLIEETLPFPQASYPLTNGVLVGVVPDANGVNRLLNPIDGSEIIEDVFGFARTTGGLRNVGAVEGLSVPEIDPASSGGGLSLVLGALAWLEQRRRFRRERVTLPRSSHA